MKKTILILLLTFGIIIGTIVNDVYAKYVLDKSINVASLEVSTLYNINYNLNGGAISGELSKYTVNHSLTLPNPSKIGYTFTGWTGTNGTTPQTNVNIVKGSTGNKTYTANWKAINYTISYNLNGGNLATTNNYNIETNTFGLGIPTKTGYIFTGWTGANGTTPQTNVSIVKGSTGNKTYTANWKATNYTISYNLNGGSLSTKNSYNIETNTFELGTPIRDGHTFTGWTGSNGGTIQTSVSIAKGSTGNKNYTANWRINTYTVTYYNTSGGWYDSRTVNFGASIPNINYNAGDWNVFTGWKYNGTAISTITMPSYNINVNANTREANCQIRTGQATDGDDSRIARFQELVGQKGLGGYWVYTQGLGNSFESNWSNYSHVMDAANHLLANAGKSSWPYLRYLLLVSETGATRALR